MRKWHARALAFVIGVIWLFGLMFIEGILVMSGAHASDSGQRTALAIVAVVAIIGIGLGTWVCCVIWRCWRVDQHATRPHAGSSTGEASATG